MTVEDVRRTHAHPALRRIMLLLTVLIILGTAATTASILTARGQGRASQADVERAAALTAELARQTVRAEQRTYDTRVDTRTLLDAICDQIEAVAVQARLNVPACPVLPPVPRPRPTPMASDADE